MINLRAAIPGSRLPARPAPGSPPAAGWFPETKFTANGN
jgi:hypothetical protein